MTRPDLVATLVCKHSAASIRETARPASASRSRSRQRMRLVTLKRRAEFLAVRGGRRASTTSFLIECKRRQQTGMAAGARFGFTITKKVGGAIERNRIRRRLREALRALPDDEAKADCDYVVVARREALTRPFAALKSDLARALASVHRSHTRTSSEP